MSEEIITETAEIEKPVIFWMDWIKVLSLRTVIMNTDLLEKLDNPK